MREGRLRQHIGIVVTPGLLLHVERGETSRIERYRSGRAIRTGWRVSFGSRQTAMNAGLVVKALHGEIISPRGSVRVVGKLHPLRGDRIECQVAAGLSIDEILCQVLADHPEMRARRDFAVHLDGHLIEQKNWRRVRVKPGAPSHLAAARQRQRLAHRRDRGGRGRGLCDRALGRRRDLDRRHGADRHGAVAGDRGDRRRRHGGRRAGDQCAVSGIKGRADQQQRGSTAAQFDPGRANQAQSFGPINVILGTHRISPNYAAKPYTEIVGDDQYLRLLFCFGYGPLAIISDLKIGETPIGSFDDVTVEIRQGFAGDPPITLYPGVVDEQSLSIKLTSAGGWQVRTTAAETDEISIDVTAPQGIFKVNTSTGALDPWEVDVPAQYRLTGSAGAWLTLGGMSFVRSTGPHRMGVTLAVPRGQYDVRVEKLTADANDTNIHDEVDWTALRRSRFQSRSRWSRCASRRPTSSPASSAYLQLHLHSLVTAYSGAGSVTGMPNTASQNPADLFRMCCRGRPMRARCR
jgi:hypothetical protein